MAKDADSVREDAPSGWKLCGWAAAVILFTFLWLAWFACHLLDPAALPSAAAPGRPSVLC